MRPKKSYTQRDIQGRGLGRKLAKSFVDHRRTHIICRAKNENQKKSQRKEGKGVTTRGWSAETVRVNAPMVTGQECRTAGWEEEKIRATNVFRGFQRERPAQNFALRKICW